jgi:parvulin-like peptidyl-prolyl isomerase
MASWSPIGKWPIIKDVIESPDFATNGQFDITKYQTWLQQLASSPDPRAQTILADFDTQIRQQLLVARIQDYVLSMVRITEADVKNDFIDKNDKAKVKYIFIPAGDFDSTVTTVQESEVKARYEKDKEQFKQPEMATLSFVQFPKAAGEADIQEAKIVIDEIYGELKGGADFAAIATERSEDPGSGKNGGDLGWFGEGRMVQEFWDAAKSLKSIGDISAPFRSQFGWHIVKLTGKRTTKDANGVEKPEYQASHILVKVEPSTETLAQLEQTANNFRNDAEKLGFKEAAQEFGLLATETKPFPAGTNVPTLGQNESVNKFAFSEKIGEITDPISSRNAIFVMQITKRTPAGYTPYDEAKTRVENAILREQRVALAHKRGEELAAQAAAGKSLEAISAETGKPILETDYFARSQFVAKVGSDPDFAGAAFGLSPQHPMSKSVNARTGAYIMQFIDRQNANLTSFAAISDSLTQEMTTNKKKDLWSKWLNALKQNAKIEDYRSTYYGS